VKKIFLFLWIVLIATQASASTFVGNGGNSTDVELQVTLLQIKKTLSQIQSQPSQAENLCRCAESLEGHQICENLKSLNADQNKECRSKLTSSAADMLNLLNHAKGVQFIWTLEAMEVSEKMGRREAEGVAVASENKIFLNREQFLKLKDYERIYLITHELGHLVTFDKKFLKDDDHIGAFKQADGGRQFLNSLGSAVAMQSLSSGSIEDYSASLRRSKTIKANWLSLSFGSESERHDNSDFAIKKYSGYQMQYRYQLNSSYGVSGGFRQLKGADTFFNEAHAESYLKFYNIKAHYRVMPFENPLTMWGQSHFVFSAGYEFGQAEMQINDGFVSVSQQTSLSSPVLSAHYYLPANNGFWIQAGLTATAYNYEFSEIGFKSQSNQLCYEAGVSYGF
jgi:hypothetical protein